MQGKSYDADEKILSLKLQLKETLQEVDDLRQKVKALF